MTSALLNPADAPRPAAAFGSDWLAAEPETQPPATRAGTRWLASLLDEVDLGLVVITRSGSLLFINRCAEQMLSSGAHPWASSRSGHWQLTASSAELLEAVQATLTRGTRKMLRLSPSAGGQLVAVLPFDAAPDAALVNLGRPQVCEPLSIQCFAMSHQLTGCESQVLTHLCNGLRPADIARQQGVLVSTVRTQISALRAKAGCDSISALIRRVALLPPMRSTLGRGQPRSADPAA